MLKPIFTMIVAGCALILSGCTSSGDAVQQAAQSGAEQQKSIGAYALGAGDKLRINVFGQPDLSGEFEVDGSGSISMPLIGQITAAGVDTPTLERTIAAKLDGDFILNPKVSAEVINYRPFYILGEVGQAGEYPYTSRLTVKNAVAAAGGFSYRANEKIVFIKHIDSSEEIKYVLDSNTLVQPGDTLRIEEKYF